ncbi:uncharacterized protein K452DRAFT_162832 [Aplosporella prunicola CBS 121167]|uniref:Uncharacterized protein n=1 Tax=Aplosporella prunicola CBS 121167 TaxID=1176127 RepID=A0A6A6BKK2_9PEZI|nr:uncharacterized protein K452DRAFT_162832 [Aplosporella prunicola CBS 121167]KAF2143814.1 hypothetical protein K452DRAFT_162832 [Aplosporella prunicola CBS 121167]
MLVPETSRRQRTPRPPAPRPRRCRRPSLTSSVDPLIFSDPRQPVNLQSNVDLTNAHRRADQSPRLSDQRKGPPIEKAASEHGSHSPAPVVSNGDVAAKPAKKKRRLPRGQLPLVPSVYVDVEADVAADDSHAYDKAAAYSQPSDPIEEADVPQGKRSLRGRGTAHSVSPKARLSSLKNMIKLPKPSADKRPELTMFKLPREANRKANYNAWLSRHGSDSFTGQERSVPFKQTKRRGRRGPLATISKSLRVVSDKQSAFVSQGRDLASPSTLTRVQQISSLSPVPSVPPKRGDPLLQHARQVQLNVNDSLSSSSPLVRSNLCPMLSLPLTRTMTPATTPNNNERTHKAYNNQVTEDYDLD